MNEGQKGAAGKPGKPVGIREVELEPAPQGPIAMSDRDVNEYLASIAQNKVELTGMEATVAGQLREATIKFVQTEQRMSRLQAELNKLGPVAQQAKGRVDAYSQLLVMAEDARRARAKGDE